jgi:hypothetical protein
MSSFFGMPLSQFPNKLVMFFGGANPNVIKIMRQTILSNGHSKKRWCMIKQTRVA